MDLYKVIQKLHRERDRLDRAIASLEEFQKGAQSVIPKNRRGRKSMDEEARKEVSERMRRYWANRRKKQKE
jgi:hypothetical protein